MSMLFIHDNDIRCCVLSVRPSSEGRFDVRCVNASGEFFDTQVGRNDLKCGSFDLRELHLLSPASYNRSM